jgi:hypothetical protein
MKISGDCTWAIQVVYTSHSKQLSVRLSNNINEHTNFKKHENFNSNSITEYFFDFLLQGQAYRKR